MKEAPPRGEARPPLRLRRRRTNKQAEEIAPWYSLPEVLFSLMIVGTLFINAGPMNIAPVDALVVVGGFILLPAAQRYWVPRFGDVFMAFGVPVLAYLLIGLALLAFVGGNFVIWLKDAFSFSSFFVCFGLLVFTRRRPSFLLPKIALIGSLFWLLSSQFAVQNDLRNQGMLPNPNHTGNWYAGAIVLMIVFAFPRIRLVRWLIIAAAIYGIQWAASLGSIGTALLAVGYAFMQKLRVRVPVQIVSTLAAVPLVFYVMVPWLQGFTSYAEETGVDRFEDTSNGRLDIWRTALESWQSQPMGLGPGGFSDSKVYILAVNGAEAHNDYIGVLTDYGAFGLIAWLVALTGLFLVGRTARPLVIYLAASSIAHSVFNFRHIWVFMALAFAMDYWNSQPKSADHSESGQGASMPDECGTAAVMKSGAVLHPPA